MSTPNKLITNLKILTIALALSVGMSYAFADWSNPPAGTTPPANNTAAPINVGSVLQTKTGPLTVSGFSSLGNVVIKSPESFHYSDRGGILRLAPSSDPSAKDYYFQLVRGWNVSGNPVGDGDKFHFSGLYGNKNTVTFDITNQKVGIKNQNPTAELDVNGKTKTSDLEVSGTVAIRGGAPGPGKVLTSVDATGNARWVDAVAGGICDTAPFQIVSINTVYQNTSSTQLIVVASAYATSVKADLEGYIGPSNTPTTLVATDSSPSMVDSRRSITFVVPPGYFYKISDTNSSAGYIAQAWKVCGGGSGGGCRSESGEITSTGPGKYPVTFNRSFYDIPMIKTYIYATSIPAPYLVPNMEVPGWTDFETTSENVNNTYWGIVLDMVTNASFKIVQQPSWVDGMRIKWIAIGDC